MPLASLRDGHQRREIMWSEERSKLENELLKLKENRESSADVESVQTTESIPIRIMNYCVTKTNNQQSGVSELKKQMEHGQQYFTIGPNNRSYSMESSTTWDSRLLDQTARSISPLKRQFGIASLISFAFCFSELIAAFKIGM